MLTVKERPLVKFFQYTGIFSVSRGSPRATNNDIFYSQNGSCVLTSKFCAEVWKTGYEFSLNPGNENSKLEMESPKD